MIPESYLMHHGVDGQKWGIQNGPPYPLDRAGKRALRAQRKQAKKDLSKAVAAESVNDYFLQDTAKKMRKAKTDREYQRLEKEFDELTKQHDTLHANAQTKAQELLKMNAGKNIKYANYKIYTKNNEVMIKTTKNIVTQHNVFKSEFPALASKGAWSATGALGASLSIYDMYKNGRNALKQYIDNL